VQQTVITNLISFAYYARLYSLLLIAVRRLARHHDRQLEYFRGIICRLDGRSLPANICGQPSAKEKTTVHTAIRRAFVLVAAVFSGSVLGDYVANQIDYVDPGNGTVANYTQLWAINNKGNALGYASFDHGVTVFSFLYDPPTGNYLRVPLPPGFDGVTSFATPIGINDAGVMTGSTFEPTGVRSFILKEGVYTLFSAPGWAETFARTMGNPTAAHPEGLVVGYVDDGVFETSDSTNGFVYDPVTSAFATLNTPSFFTIAHGQNVLGEIVGGIIADGSSLPSGRWGFLFTPTTGADPILGGTVDYFRVNGMRTAARGINDSGLIAAAVYDATGATQTYVGTSGGFQQISVPGSTGPRCPDGFTLPGTFPEHINNAGQVAGLLTDSACNFHGFIATPASLPTGTTRNGAYTFSVDLAANAPIFISAPTAIGYDYALGEHDPRFASVRLPLGIGNNKFILVVRRKAFAVNAGQLFDFRAHGFKKGVEAFRVACIDPAARLHPVNSLAFPTELTFVAQESQAAQVQWRAGMETRDLSEWSEKVNTDSADTTVVTAAGVGIPPRGGSWVMKQAVTGPAGGTRMSRYPEIDALAKAGTTFYYSWWNFFPTTISFGESDFYNHWQIASNDASNNGAPIWALVFDGSGNTMQLLWSPNRLAPANGPHDGETGKRAYTSSMAVPTNQWEFFEVMITPRSDFTGAIKIWLNGQVLFDLSDIKTQFPYVGQRILTWVTNNAYGSGLTPTPYVHYIDDVTVSLGRMPKAGKFTGTQRPLIRVTGEEEDADSSRHGTGEPISQAECRRRLLSRHHDDREADD
jgi:polysaccharide lyase-like protein